MKIKSKATGVVLENVRFPEFRVSKNLKENEASVETIFETMLKDAGYGTVNDYYTKRTAKHRAVDKFRSKNTDVMEGYPDYIFYEKKDTDKARIIAVADVKKPEDGGSDNGLADAKFYIEGYNSNHQNKIRIALGYDGYNLKVQYLSNVDEQVWEDIFIDGNKLELMPPVEFMKFIDLHGNYVTTNIKKSIDKEILEPYFAEADKILRRSKISSSPVDKAIEFSVFIFLRVFSVKNLDSKFKQDYGHKIWDYVKEGKVDAVNTSFVKYLKDEFKEVFPSELITVEKRDAIQISKLIDLMFEKYEIADFTDVKGNAMEYYQKDSKDKKIGEFYTSSHLTELIVRLLDPRIEFKLDDSGKYIVDEYGNNVISHIDSIYDCAVGSGGFLIQAYQYFLNSYSKYGVSSKSLEDNVFFGTELKEKTVMLTKLNMILLGVGHHNIVRGSSISYVLTHKLKKKKVNGSEVLLTRNEVEEFTEESEVGTVYTYRNKKTKEPVVHVPKVEKYFLATVKNDKLVKKKANRKTVEVHKSEVKSFEVDGRKGYLFIEDDTPVIAEIKEEKFILGEYVVNKSNIPQTESIHIKAVNEVVRAEHGEYFGKFDIAVSNHPYGLEEPKKADELFIRHMIESVKDGGKIGCIVGENLLFDAKYKNFREYLQENFTVESIISLPQGVFYPYTDVKTSILLIKKEKAHKDHKTWLVNVLHDGFELTPSRNPTPEHNDFPKLRNLWWKWGGDVMSEFSNSGEEFEVYRSYHRTESQFAEFHDLSPKNWCVKYYIHSFIEYDSKYDLYPISDILKRKKDKIEIQNEDEYKRVTIQVNNRGIILRDIEEGKNIGTKNQFVINAGQFLISKIDARNGAYGLVSDDLGGAIITNNFWTFDINTDLILPKFLEYLMRIESFRTICTECSFGSTNRWYLDEETFNAYQIPIPGKPEQQEILNEIAVEVEKIDELMKQIEACNDNIKATIESLFTG